MSRSRKIAAGTADAGTSMEYLDTRLVAAVQTAAGARCHEAANLLQAYYNSAEAYRRLSAGHRGNATDAAEEARQLLHAAKARLRDFLAERLLGWINASPERRLDRDHPASPPSPRPVIAVTNAACRN